MPKVTVKRGKKRQAQKLIIRTMPLTVEAPEETSPFCEGQRVMTSKGKGMIVDIQQHLHLVQHDVPSAGLHDGNGYGRVTVPECTGWWYNEREMELVESKNGFEVGDRVERIELCNGTDVPVGSRGTVSGLRSKETELISVDWDHGKGNGYGNYPKYLRKLTPEEELEIGGCMGDDVESDFTFPTPTQNIEQQIRDAYPHGHPQFAEITIGELKLHSEKNHDYAAGGDPLGNFKRVASILSLYPGLKLDDPAIVAFVYAMKQIDAYLWLKSNGHTAKVEGTGKRLEDVSVYSKLVRIIDDCK